MNSSIHIDCEVCGATPLIPVEGYGFYCWNCKGSVSGVESDWPFPKMPTVDKSALEAEAKAWYDRTIKL